MRRENQAKTAAEFNHLFDHGEISVSRSTAGRIQLYDRRLSLHWMLQPEAAYEGLHNPLLSKMGFWPRFLFAWPPPSQPRKAIPFRPEQDSRIREYWERCQALIDYPLREDCADLPVLEATPEADDLACRFFEQMEVAAKSKDGILRDARAFALRATELAFRVAGELVIFRSQDRLRAHIDLESMRNGIELVAYSLETWRAAHGDRHETEMRSNAFRLYEWLLNQPQVSVLETSILHIGPRATRSQSRRDTALSLLQQAKLVFCEGRTWKAKIE